MAEGIFTIIEKQRLGGTTATDFRGERFDWTSDKAPQQLGIFNLVKGGARACPISPWPFGGELTSVRTDYPDAKTPSEQVLGPKHTPFALNGDWKDKWNFDGYAVKEMRRFEAMCRRGNLCSFQFQDQIFEGLIKTWDFDYRRSWDIGYSFTVSVHDRPDDYEINDRAPPHVISPRAMADEHNEKVAAVTAANDDAVDRGLASFMGGQVMDDVASSVASIEKSAAAVDAVVEDREYLPDVKPTDAFKRFATQLRTSGNLASGLIQDMTSFRSDVELGVRTCLSVLDFEAWSRSLRFQLRILLSGVKQDSDLLDERADPSAQRLYRPAAGESLYGVSQSFYGTPHAWRLIADRNNLTDFTLDGTETLIIPERGDV